MRKIILLLSLSLVPIVGSASSSAQPGLVDECAYREASGFIGTIGGSLSLSDLDTVEEVIQGTCVQDLGLAEKEGLGEDQAAAAVDRGTRRAMATLGIALTGE